MRSKKTKDLTLFAFFLAVELILLFTPLGFLRIGPLSATLMHIPVIIAAVTMGLKYGIALGLIFGLLYKLIRGPQNIYSRWICIIFSDF